MTARDGFDPVEVSRCASKANQIAETAIEQVLHHPGTNEACSPRYEDRIIWRNDEGIVHEALVEKSSVKLGLGRYRCLLMDAQPFFKDYEAEEDFVMVLSPR